MRTRPGQTGTDALSDRQWDCVPQASRDSITCATSYIVRLRRSIACVFNEQAGNGDIKRGVRDLAAEKRIRSKLGRECNYGRSRGSMGLKKKSAYEIDEREMQESSHNTTSKRTGSLALANPCFPAWRGVGKTELGLQLLEPRQGRRVRSQ